MAATRFDLLDPLIFSSALAAGAAGALLEAVNAATGAKAPATAAAVAVAGTLCVYNIDRLRDIERDRNDAPERTHFVERNQQRLTVLAVASGALAGGLGFVLGPAAIALCATALGLGLLHRRLKRWTPLKTLYVSAAWIAIVVGLPLATAAGEPRVEGWALAIVASAIGANLLASNTRERVAHPAAPRAEPTASAALLLAGAGVLTGLLAPPSVRPLALVSLAELVSLLGARTRFAAAQPERYGLLVVDGALALGAAAALAWIKMVGF